MGEYLPKQPDENGYIAYTREENEIWSELYAKQIKLLEGRSCEEHIALLKLLDLPKNEVPQINDVNKRMKFFTSWQLVPVTGMISFDEFFSMLSQRRFPAATFVRRREDFAFVDKPDIFHEIFGHAPLLMHSTYAEFSRLIGESALGESPAYQKLVAAIYWYTCETGAVLDDNGDFRIYGASTISSSAEIVHATTTGNATVKHFDVRDMVSNAYRISELTKTYYHIPDLHFLGSLTRDDIKADIRDHLASVHAETA